jgi:hypothetical protein
MDAIGGAPVNDAAEQAARDTLLTEAAFADFAHDIPKAQRLVRGLFTEAELHAWGRRRQAIIAAAVDGLFSQSVAAQCAEKLAEWMPDHHGYGRHGAIHAMRKRDRALRPACVPLLIRVIAGDQESATRAAGVVLAEFARNAEVKGSLLGLVHQPNSAETLRGALFALGQGWSGDADVGALAAELRHSPLANVQIDAIRIRASRGEADVGDLDIFEQLAFRRERFSSDVLAPDLVEYFASRNKPELLAHLERACEKRERRSFDIQLLGALIIAEPTHRLVEPMLREVLADEWSLHELFTRSKAPLDRITWTPRLIRLVEEKLPNEKHRDYDWYWVAKVLKLPLLKERMIASLKAGEGLIFWSSRGLAEVWGKNDSDVYATFRVLLDAPAESFAEAADDAASVLDDRVAVRGAILRALRAKPRETRFLIEALHRLGIDAEDDEAFGASYQAGDPKDPSYHYDFWRGAMIRTFAGRPEVRDLARAELTIRDGNLAAVADAYASDTQMCQQVMKVIAPLPDAARLALVPELASAAPSNPSALNLLTAARNDTHGATAGEAVMAWTDACVAQNALGKDEREFLAGELHAIGPEYEHRRAAAAVGVIVSDNIEIFANLKDHKGEPQNINISPRIPSDESDRYLKRVLSHWDCVASALGGEETALARLELSPESTLAVINPGSPGAERVFELLDTRAVAGRTPFRERIGAMQRFAPDSEGMRKLIEPLLLRRGSAPGLLARDSGHGPNMMAAEIFAEHFTRSDLRESVIDAFNASPANDCAAAALAEIALREGDTTLEALLREKTSGLSYELVTWMRLAAAIGNIVDALEWLLRKDPDESLRWTCSYWVPAFLRRIERDELAADEIIAALDRAPSASARLSELALLGLGCKDKAKTRPILGASLRAYGTAPAPVVAFDVTAGAYRLAVHTVGDLLY